MYVFIEISTFSIGHYYLRLFIKLSIIAVHMYVLTRVPTSSGGNFKEKLNFNVFSRIVYRVGKI